LSAPRWTRALLRRLARPDEIEEVLGDLEEAHRTSVARRGRLIASALTAIETLDMAAALLRERRRSPRTLPVVSWLDLKLGLRMLVKHPALSLVSALGMTLAVAIGTSAFGAIHAITASRLPLDEGERIVTIQNTGWGGLGQERATHLHDLPLWRSAMRTIQGFGAYRIVTRNLLTEDGDVTTARVVEMTASGFDIARVPPLLGRTLIEADERAGAADVTVIGYGVWQDRFGGATDVLGRTLRIGSTPHTVVGVMPQGFAFPINNRVWAPLRLNPLDHRRGEAPAIDVFARVAPGYSLGDVQVELTTLGARLAAAYPDTQEEMQPRVYPYTQELIWGPTAWFLRLGQVLASMLLVVIAINVAVLVYARTATRSDEIVVRSALGASRARVAAQLFAEAFVLSSLAAAAGLFVARWGLEWIAMMAVWPMGEQVPFWWDFSLTPAAAAYSFGLAVLAAVIIGVVPALGMTGRRLRAGLQNVASRAAAPRLGRTWTTLIVAQVAFAVAVLPVGLNAVGSFFAGGPRPTNLTLDGFLSARLDFEEDDRPAAADRTDMIQARQATLSAVAQRLEAEPEVSRVLLMEVSPWGDPDLRFELEGREPPAGESFGALESAGTGTLVGTSRVGPEFFEALGVPLVTGRYFTRADVAAASDVVVVNHVFVEHALAGVSPLGRRIRFGTSGNPEPGTEEAVWYTIVGVVEDHWGGFTARPEAKAFLPMKPGGPLPRYLAVELRGDPAPFIRRVLEVASGVDPKLQVTRLVPLADVYRDGEGPLRVIALTLAALALSVLLLAVAGLYALMSFTVVRRRREIGIRAALGGTSYAVLRPVLARALVQLAVGVAAGLALAALTDRALGGEMLSGRGAVLLPMVAALMTAVGVAAAWGPARRGLNVQPTEALRAD
jgi:predicted permease